MEKDAIEARRLDSEGYPYLGFPDNKWFPLKVVTPAEKKAYGNYLNAVGELLGDMFEEDEQSCPGFIESTTWDTEEIFRGL